MRLVMLVFGCSCGLCSGKVTLLLSLLVMGRLLRLVVLVFEGCPELYGEVLLFIVGCWLLCDRYVWSYWFSKNVLNFVREVLLFIVGCWLLCDSVCLVILVFALPCLNCCYFFYLKSCLLFMRSVRLVVMVSLAVD